MWRTQAQHTGNVTLGFLAFGSAPTFAFVQAEGDDDNDDQHAGDQQGQLQVHYGRLRGSLPNRSARSRRLETIRAPRSVARGTREAGSGSGADASDRVGGACIPRSGRIPQGAPALRCAVASSPCFAWGPAP